MAKTATLPKLRVSDVKRRFSGPYFQRGQDYYHRGNLFDPIRKGNVLEARCFGSTPTPYRVRAVLNDAGIKSTDCSCPIGGDCKHTVALLLTWVHQPERFQTRLPIDDLLKTRSKGELIRLIKEMIKRDPDLEILLDLPLFGGGTNQQPVDPEPYRRQLRAAFLGGSEWGPRLGTAAEIHAIIDLADQCAAAGDWSNAKTIYQVVMEEGRANYQRDAYDEEEILAEIDGAAEGLADCLAAFEDARTRQEVLRSLFEVIQWDVNKGGFGVGERLHIILFEQSSPEERQLLRQWILQESAKADGLSGWQKDAWGNLLLQLDERDGDIDGFLERARSHGMYRALFDKLVDVDRLKEAREVAETHLHTSDYAFLQSALTLEEAGHPSEAIEMVSGKLPVIEDPRLLGWLADNYESQGNFQDALRLQLQRWAHRPSLADYQTLERIAKSLDQWQALRPELLSGLAANNHFEVLARVHLYEEAWEAAWEAAVQGSKRSWASSIQEEVAQAIEPHHPLWAIEFYLFRAEGLIARRGRKNYAAAADYLQKVRRLSEAIGQMDAWQQTIKAIRENNRNLPAFQDELNKAGF